ncbi:P13 family porin [Borreliella japonica]|nr:P13 family porin [Borreliella japonica]
MPKSLSSIVSETVQCAVGAQEEKREYPIVGINISRNRRSIATTASYITSLVIPFTFANKYNANLRKRLGISLAGFEPNFDIGINGFQLYFKSLQSKKI